MAEDALVLPPGKSLMVGKPWMRNCCARDSSAVASTHPSVAPVLESFWAASSHSGRSCLQCPHLGKARNQMDVNQLNGCESIKWM